MRKTKKQLQEEVDQLYQDIYTLVLGNNLLEVASVKYRYMMKFDVENMIMFGSSDPEENRNNGFYSMIFDEESHEVQTDVIERWNKLKDSLSK